MRSLSDLNQATARHTQMHALITRLRKCAYG